MTFVIVTHVLICFFLIFIVLIQPGTQGGVGAALGGGGGSTFFGGRGANTLLSRLTAGAAFAFMITCALLAYYSTQRGSVFDNAPEVIAENDEGQAENKDTNTADAVEQKPETNESNTAAAKPAAPEEDKNILDKAGEKLDKAGEKLDAAGQAIEEAAKKGSAAAADVAEKATGVAEKAVDSAEKGLEKVVP